MKGRVLAQVSASVALVLFPLLCCPHQSFSAENKNITEFNAEHGKLISSLIEGIDTAALDIIVRETGAAIEDQKNRAEETKLKSDEIILNIQKAIEENGGVLDFSMTMEKLMKARRKLAELLSDRAISEVGFDALSEEKARLEGDIAALEELIAAETETEPDPETQPTAERLALADAYDADAQVFADKAAALKELLPSLPGDISSGDAAATKRNLVALAQDLRAVEAPDEIPGMQGLLNATADIIETVLVFAIDNDKEIEDEQLKHLAELANDLVKRISDVVDKQIEAFEKAQKALEEAADKLRVKGTALAPLLSALKAALASYNSIIASLNNNPTDAEIEAAREALDIAEKSWKTLRKVCKQLAELYKVQEPLLDDFVKLERTKYTSYVLAKVNQNFVGELQDNLAKFSKKAVHKAVSSGNEAAMSIAESMGTVINTPNKPYDPTIPIPSGLTNKCGKFGLPDGYPIAFAAYNAQATQLARALSHKVQHYRNCRVSNRCAARINKHRKPKNNKKKKTPAALTKAIKATSKAFRANLKAEIDKAYLEIYGFPL